MESSYRAGIEDRWGRELPSWAAHAKGCVPFRLPVLLRAKPERALLSNHAVALTTQKGCPSMGKAHLGAQAPEPHDQPNRCQAHLCGGSTPGTTALHQKRREAHKKRLHARNSFLAWVLACIAAKRVMPSKL